MIDKKESNKWLTLIILLTGTLLPPLDFFIVNIAIPEIQKGLDTSSAVTQLIVSIYAISYAVTLVFGGRLGDIYGRKLIFIVGLIGFGLASAISGFAINSFTLVFGRLLQGIFAAIMAPQSLAIIRIIFHDKDRTRAMVIYGATVGLASAIGQALGGVLIDINLLDLGWRSIFIINIPIIIIALPAALFFIDENKQLNTHGIDMKGAFILITGLTALIIPLIEGREQGFPLWCIFLFLLSFLILWIFWKYEKDTRKKGSSSLVVPSIFKNKGLCRCLLSTCLFFSIMPFFLTFSIYQQSVLGFGPMDNSIGILPLGIGCLIGPFLNPGISRYFGNNTFTLGTYIEGLSLITISIIVCTGFHYLFFIPLFTLGFGQGLALPAIVKLTVEQVDVKYAGLAAGLVNSTLQISGALSVAVVGGVFFWISSSNTSDKIRDAFAIELILIAILLIISGSISKRNHLLRKSW
ncbi:MFS transporter [Pantoea cypripedii]|uniref:Major facilitator superfamily (MFS) profile domain-containing protein n=1 Tax=Pantoea cypripedii TaxID=55209 RepID=A0A1X1EY56_PANCY|nr:MFS transporter [Pantoea cypripedii]ORM94960.1 hypothetical protein HA50_17055 [Pantoea cypripedii]